MLKKFSSIHKVILKYWSWSFRLTRRYFEIAFIDVRYKMNDCSNYVIKIKFAFLKNKSENKQKIFHEKNNTNYMNKYANILTQ